MAFLNYSMYLVFFGVFVSTSEVLGLKFKESQIGLLHVASGFWVDGSGKLGELTNTGKFILKIEDETGCIYFTQGNKTLVPSRGCAHKSKVELQEHDPLEITRRWSLNSDGTIGNACDPTTRLVVNAKEDQIELRKVDDCAGTLQGRIQFVSITYQ